MNKFSTAFRKAAAGLVISLAMTHAVSAAGLSVIEASDRIDALDRMEHSLMAATRQSVQDLSESPVALLATDRSKPSCYTLAAMPDAVVTLGYGGQSFQAPLLAMARVQAHGEGDALTPDLNPGDRYYGSEDDLPAGFSASGPSAVYVGCQRTLPDEQAIDRLADRQGVINAGILQRLAATTLHPLIVGEEQALKRKAGLDPADPTLRQAAAILENADRMQQLVTQTLQDAAMLPPALDPGMPEGTTCFTVSDRTFLNTTLARGITRIFKNYVVENVAATDRVPVIAHPRDRRYYVDAAALRQTIAGTTDEPQNAFIGCFPTAGEAQVLRDSLNVWSGSSYRGWSDDALTRARKVVALAHPS